MAIKEAPIVLSYGRGDAEVTSQQTIYKGYHCLEDVTMRHKLFAGGWSVPFQRECLQRNPVAAILPYDPKKDLLVLLEQCRVGPLKGGDNPWLIEVVAGVHDVPNESMEDLAKREATEEAGVKVQALKLMHRYWVSPGTSTEHVTLFCGKIDAPDEGSIHGVSEQNEDIRTMVVTVDQALEALACGKICNAVAVIALQWLLIHRESIRKEWS